MAGLAFGGGKAVIIGDSRPCQDAAAVRGLRPLRRLARRALHHRRGRRHDHRRHGERGAHHPLRSRASARAPGEAGGDPGPKTALGVYLGIKAAVQIRPRAQRSQRRQRRGAGGRRGRLSPVRACWPREGARLTVADVRPAAVERVCDEFGARAVSPEEVLAQAVDVLSPCALGAVLNPTSIPAAPRPHRRGSGQQPAGAGPGRQRPARPPASSTPPTTSSTPAASSASPTSTAAAASEAQVIAEIQGIPARLTEIFERARRENRTTNAVADQMARERLGRHSPPQAA